MSPPILLRSPPVRTQPLLNNASTARRGRRAAGEMAGGTAAECTAIICCFPCTVMNIVVLAVYKVPAGLCKKAIHNHKRNPPPRKVKTNDVLLQERTSTFAASDYAVTTLEDHLAPGRKKNVAGAGANADVADNGGEFSESGELEKEMWAQFNGIGFWRSPSQAEQLS